MKFTYQAFIEMVVQIRFNFIWQKICNFAFTKKLFQKCKKTSKMHSTPNDATHEEKGFFTT